VIHKAINNQIILLFFSYINNHCLAILQLKIVNDIHL